MSFAAASFPPQWNRAVAYGDGFFETIVVLAGVAPLWSFHRARIENSLQRLSILVDLNELESTFFSLATQKVDALIKITIARSGGGRGYSAKAVNDSVFTTDSYPLPHYPRRNLTDGVNLFLCRQRLSHNPALAGIKHLNRLEQVLAASEWCREWAHEGLMLDVTGAVVEGTVSNIFVLSDNVLLTPRLDYCGVAGVMRSAILNKFAVELNLETCEERIGISDVLEADAVFICNSVFGVWPVKSIGVSPVRGNHSIIDGLWQSLNALGYSRLYG